MFGSLRFQIDHRKIERGIAKMPFFPFFLSKSLNLDIQNRFLVVSLDAWRIGQWTSTSCAFICMYVGPCIYAENIDMTAGSQQLVNKKTPTYSKLQTVNLISGRIIRSRRVPGTLHCMQVLHTVRHIFIDHVNCTCWMLSISFLRHSHIHFPEGYLVCYIDAVN